MNSIWLVELYYPDLTLRRAFHGEDWYHADCYLRQHIGPDSTCERWNIENIAFTDR